MQHRHQGTSWDEPNWTEANRIADEVRGFSEVLLDTNFPGRVLQSLPCLFQDLPHETLVSETRVESRSVDNISRIASFEVKRSGIIDNVRNRKIQAWYG